MWQDVVHSTGINCDFVLKFFQNQSKTVIMCKISVSKRGKLRNLKQLSQLRHWWWNPKALFFGSAMICRELWILFYIVSVLGYTVKYSLRPREIPSAGYISPYIPTWVIIQTLSIFLTSLSTMKHRVLSIKMVSKSPVLSSLVGQYW